MLKDEDDCFVHFLPEKHVIKTHFSLVINVLIKR